MEINIINLGLLIRRGTLSIISEEQIEAVSEEYRASLRKAGLSRLQELDVNSYISLEVVAISSSVLQKDKNQTWVKCLNSGNEFSFDFPADFAVREGHVIVALELKQDKGSATERYLNLTTGTYCSEMSGLFNWQTIRNTKSSSCINFILSFVPSVGSIISLSNLGCQHPKVSSLSKRYYNVFYNRFNTWVLSLIIISIAVYQFILYPQLTFFPWIILFSIKLQTPAVFSVYIAPVVVLMITRLVRRKRKKRVERFITTHCEYLEKVIHILANNEEYKASCFQNAQAIMSAHTNQNDSLDTKECPECAEIIKLNAKKCRFCGAVC